MGFLLESVALEFLGVLLAALFTVYIYIKYGIYTYWTKKGVVQCEPTVPFGNMLPTLRKEKYIGECFADAYKKMKHNRYFGFYSFHIPNLVIADPDLIRYIVVKDFNHFHDRGLYSNEKVDPLSEHLFFMGGEKWNLLRAKLSPTFTSGKIKYMFSTVKKCGNLLESIMEDKAKAGEIVEMKDILARYSTDIISSVAFGIEANSLKNPDADFRYWGRKFFEPNLLKNVIGLFAPILLDIFSIPFNQPDASKFFINAFNETVSYRKSNNVARNDFLQLVIQLMEKGHLDGEEVKQEEGTNVKMTDLQGAAQAFVFFVAGFETSSSTVTHCLYELALNQKIQDRLSEDISEGLKKSGGLNYESLAEMPYLHKVINETLRKYPSVGFLNRVCTEDYDLPTTNLHIAKGTPLVIPVLGLHTDPDIYPDPEKFDPERFSEENIASRHQYTYLPFGDGPRICIGMRFGLVQTKVALISLLSKYRFKLGPNTPVPLVSDKGSAVLTPEGGLDLRIELR